MKRFFLIYCLYLSFSSSALAATIEQVFIPQGFDDNDNVQIVVQGQLPSTCWQVTGVDVKKESDFDFSVEVISTRANRICVPVAIPFHRVVDLGTLNSGEYIVRAGYEKMPRYLRVAKSTSGQKDERMYANITAGYVKDQTLTLKGLHPDSTFKMEETQVTVHDKVIEVLPIAQSSRGSGLFVTIPFDTTVDLSKIVKTGETYLIHVRSLNGNALNLVETF
jgi:hypothetical protein